MLTFELHLEIIELASIFCSYNKQEQCNFLQYVQDEYAAMDDEFTFIIDIIITELYNHLDDTPTELEEFEQMKDDLCENLEVKLVQACEKHPQSIEMLQIVINNILFHAKL